jgi:uncharacterized protein
MEEHNMSTPTVPLAPCLGGGFSEEAAVFADATDEAEVVPGSAAEEQALADFVRAARAHYGTAIVTIVLFGGRARGDARPSSDADVAIVLADGGWVSWKERHMLSDLSYDVLLDRGLNIHAWPLRASEWERIQNASRIVQDIRRVGRDISSLK